MVLSRTRKVTAWVAFAVTFLWVFGSAPESGPAVVWPSVLAIGLAFVTRQIYLALFLGAWSGAILLRHGHPFLSFLDLFEKHLLPALGDSWNVSVLVFTLLMGGLVEVLNRGGGLSQLAARMMGRSHSRRRAGLGVWVMGWLLFFDGLANAMLVGKTMRPLAERTGMSREKLAFIVDSTSAPIAGLALISTWVAYELSVIKQGLEQVDPLRQAAAAAMSPLAILVESLPYRFYNYYLLLIVFLVVWRLRDFGPMRQAENNAARKTAAPKPTSTGRTPAPNRAAWWAALGPVLILILGVVVGLFVQGGGLTRPLTWSSVMQAFGDANAALVFVWATALASLAALLVAPFGGDRGGAAGTGVIDSFFHGLQQMFLPALVLVFAWMLNSVLKELGTAAYLVSFLSERWPAEWLPVAVFVLAAVVSFSTGTSWGTMALVMPLVIPLALGMAEGNAETVASTRLAATVGAVLAGAVFGDHCSPISDTTIVSAVSCGCGVMDHVRTQLPYALAAAVMAVILGYGPAGWNMSPWWLLLLGGVACWLLLQFLGKPSSRPYDP